MNLPVKPEGYYGNSKYFGLIGQDCIITNNATLEVRKEYMIFPNEEEYLEYFHSLTKDISRIKHDI